MKLGQVYHHPIVSSYLDVGAEALVRWVALKGYRGNGNRLASTLYEVDLDVQAEIEQASQKPDARRKQVPAPYGLPFTCATNGHLDLWCCMPAREKKSLWIHSCWIKLTRGSSDHTYITIHIRAALFVLNFDM